MGENFSEAGLDRLQQTLIGHVAGGYAPGIVGLVARGQEIHVFPVGTKGLDGPEPVQRESIFRIASMTKPITAVAVMMLVEDGKIRLDEPIDRLLPELAGRPVLRRINAELDDTVPMERPITVEDLLTFRMGHGIILAPPGSTPLQRRIEELGIVGFGPPDQAAPFDNDAWMARLGSLPLAAQPGADWLYACASNVQGVLIARATGGSLSAFLEERIFGPLGMVDTGFSVPPAKIDRLVSGYRSGAKGLELFDTGADGLWSRQPIFEAGDSGLVSTVDDYLAFARTLLGGGFSDGKRLLSPASVKAMTINYLTPRQRAGGEPILGKGRGWGYGMGVAVECGVHGHAPGTLSWAGGFGTSWFSDPSAGLTAILLTQRLFERPSYPAVHHDFEAGAYDALA